jgi:hypothetical protein
MKINEIIQEGIWDNLKTAGQNVKQGAGTFVNKVGQGARSAYNTVVQPQARRDRMAQAAAAQEITPAELRMKNVGTFTGDLAKTISQASSGQSYFTQATPTIPKQTIPAGATVDTEFGRFKYSAQGWMSQSNQVQKDPQLITHLTNKYYQQHGDDQPTAQPISVGGQTINPNDPKYATLMKQLQQAQKIT